MSQSNNAIPPQVQVALEVYKARMGCADRSVAVMRKGGAYEAATRCLAAYLSDIPVKQTAKG